MMKKFIALLCCFCVMIFCVADSRLAAIPTMAAADMPQISPLSALSLLENRIAKITAASVHLQVPFLYQYPELPNGCEMTSLASLLCYYGYDADKTILAQDYLPRVDFTLIESVGGSANEPIQIDLYGPNPAQYYAGDPASAELGYYCFAQPVTDAANAYLSAQNAPQHAVNCSGADAFSLMTRLYHKQPVIVWITLALAPAAKQPSTSWTLPNGATYVPYRNLHCVLLTGYDADYFYYADPLYGAQMAEKELFMTAYHSFARQAVTVQTPYAPRLMATK